MERSKSALAHSSSYGQACTQCYKAKCRCVRTPSGDTCERCIRLKKRCEPSESVRRRNAQSTQTAKVSDRRIARLEDKMESLLSAMQSFIGTTASSASSANVIQPQQLNCDGLPSSTSYSNSSLVTPASSTLGFNEGQTFAPDSLTTVSPNSNQNAIFLSQPYVPSTPAPSPNHADERLHFFRTRMLPSFPFLDLTPDMTSWYLRQNRPFLFQAIHTVTTFSTQERLTQVEELKRLIFTSALLKVQSNIDLLLGLLTYLAWSTDPFLGRADLVSRLMMLAISLVISSHLGRQDALRWTPQMEEALRVLTISEACPSDRLFVAQVRLQLLKQRSDEARQQDEARTGTAPTAASAPRLLYLKTLRRELQELRASFPPDLHQIDVLNTHAQYVELYINQLAYSISQDSLPLDLAGRMGTGSQLGFQRLECLWQSVENIKSWLDNFYKIPCSKLVGQPFHFWSQMILTITLLKYLTTLKDPDWDCQAVRNTVHLISTMDCMLQKLDLSSKEPELQCNDHLLKFLSKLLSRCRVWAEARWNIASQMQDGDTRQCRSANPDTNSHNYYIPDLDQMVFMQSMDLGDDQWFENVLGMPTMFY
uniref:Transcription factor ATEG_07667 n=1 Tax=Aspergillus terreus (strain NIH 2624 / FGSC A1156) TaxID=341663 RepID=AZPB7_ASPTN|nr:RecName: Full=Transcription factor ATEG_07667; AltName: Full=Azasperpyranone A biosynthesis cluster B protein ATEG_07667 [Aspergillus terreus NIH2624]